MSDASSSWIKELTVKEMKQLLKNGSSVVSAAAAKCVERGELEALVHSQFASLQGARETLTAIQNTPTADADPSSSSSSATTTSLFKLQSILGQDRGKTSFTQYQTSQKHKDRLDKYKTVAPDIFDNPQKTPRTKWFSHANWSKNPQMPSYHVHFRDEMQQVFRYLYNAYHASIITTTTTTTKDKATNSRVVVSSAIQRAHSMFVGSMQGLSGHVRIEEQTLFPMLKRKHPTVDISFLYDDHKHLHKLERVAQSHLEQLVVMTRQQQQQQQALDEKRSSSGLLPEKKNNTTMQILNATLHVLAFDDALVNHLGEEEEVVVPLMLSSPNLRF
jgi:iron-sulfur cluster repair protein YtfE (RIC family)